MSRRDSCPILYSARYYSPPHRPQQRSFYHLYRINPDGSGRRQITRDRADDREVRWSPDGSQIAFVRSAAAYRETAGPATLCVCDRHGAVRELYRSDGLGVDFQWLHPHTLLVGDSRPGPTFGSRSFLVDSRTGHRRALRNDQDDTGLVAPDGKTTFLSDPPRLRRVWDRATAALPREIRDALWLSPTRLLALLSGGGAPFDPDQAKSDDRDYLAEIGLDGRVIRTWKMVLSADAEAQIEHALIRNATIITIPHHPDIVLVGSLRGGTSIGEWHEFLRLDLTTHRAVPWAEARFPSFSPDGRQFVTSYLRTLIPYGSTGKQLYVRPLYAASTSVPERQRAVDGLAMVDSFDWRPV